MDGAQRLSPLQRRILVLAFRNKLSEHRPFDLRNGADLFYAEVLSEVFQFPAQHPPRTQPHNHIFDPASIGITRYLAASASLSRSMLRLAKHGLIQSVYNPHGTSWSGCNLTPDGYTVAQRLYQALI